MVDHGGPGPHPGVDVTFLPLADDDGVPLYDGSTLDLISELNADGVRARTWHPAEICEFVSDRGLITDTLLQVGVGVASSAGWYALQALLRRRTGQVRVVAIFDDGTQRRRAEVSGDPAGVADALKRLDPFGSEQS